MIGNKMKNKKMYSQSCLVNRIEKSKSYYLFMLSVLKTIFDIVHITLIIRMLFSLLSKIIIDMGYVDYYRKGTLNIIIPTIVIPYVLVNLFTLFLNKINTGELLLRRLARVLVYTCLIYFIAKLHSVFLTDNMIINNSNFSVMLLLCFVGIELINILRNKLNKEILEIIPSSLGKAIGYAVIPNKEVGE